jgi:hypothetical protein
MKKAVALPTGKRPGGRRAKREPKPGTRVVLSVRVPAEVKRAIDDAAAARGWSQGHEVEYRLKHTTDREGLLLDALSLRHGPVVAVILMALSDGVRNIAQYGASIAREERQMWSIDAWSDAPDPFEKAVATIDAILDDLHPLRRENIPDDEHHHYGQDEKDSELLTATTWEKAIRRSADLATMSAATRWEYLKYAHREYLRKARRERGKHEEKTS